MTKDIVEAHFLRLRGLLCRIRTPVILLALVVVGFGAPEGKQSVLMAKERGVDDLTAKQIEEKCLNIRRVLLGPDGKGGLEHDAQSARARLAQLQPLWNAVHNEPPTVPTKTIDDWMARDIKKLKDVDARLRASDPEWDPNWRVWKEQQALLRRDLDYWTALKERGLVDVKITRARDQYPPVLQKAIAQEEKRINELTSQIRDERDIADSIKCQAVWDSHPIDTGSASTSSGTNAPSGTSGAPASGTGPSWEPVRIKVVATVSCLEDDTSPQVPPLFGATISFAGNAGTKSARTDDAGVGRVAITPGTYKVSMPKGSLPGQAAQPQFGDAKVLWFTQRVTANPGKGDKFPAANDQGEVSLTFIPISSPELDSEYIVGVRVVSLNACQH